MTWPGSNRLREHPAWRHAGVPLEGWSRYFPRFFPRLRLPPSSKNLGRNSPSNSRRKFPRLSSTFQRQLDARRAGTGIRACLDGERRLCGDAAQDFEDAFKILGKERNDMSEASSAKPFSGRCASQSRRPGQGAQWRSSIGTNPGQTRTCSVRKLRPPCGRIKKKKPASH